MTQSITAKAVANLKKLYLGMRSSLPAACQLHTSSPPCTARVFLEVPTSTDVKATRHAKVTIAGRPEAGSTTGHAKVAATGRPKACSMKAAGREEAWADIELELVS